MNDRITMAEADALADAIGAPTVGRYQWAREVRRYSAHEREFHRITAAALEAERVADLWTDAHTRQTSGVVDLPQTPATTFHGRSAWREGFDSPWGW